MAKSRARSNRGPSLLGEQHRVALGPNRLKRTGTDPHDPRPARVRTRRTARDAAIAEFR